MGAGRVLTKVSAGPGGPGVSREVKRAWGPGAGEQNGTQRQACRLGEGPGAGGEGGQERQGIRGRRSCENRDHFFSTETAAPSPAWSAVY